jgi:hypothetical protein
MGVYINKSKLFSDGERSNFENKKREFPEMLG